MFGGGEGSVLGEERLEEGFDGDGVGFGWGVMGLREEGPDFAGEGGE